METKMRTFNPSKREAVLLKYFEDNAAQKDFTPEELAKAVWESNAARPNNWRSSIMATCRSLYWKMGYVGDNRLTIHGRRGAGNKASYEFVSTGT
jgi:hypothetical protein